jgi:hypothetical protein
MPIRTLAEILRSRGGAGTVAQVPNLTAKISSD